MSYSLTWEDFVEHYAKHLIRGDRLVSEGPVLKEWLISENLLYEEDSNEWKTVGCGGKKGKTSKTVGEQERKRAMSEEP